MLEDRYGLRSTIVTSQLSHKRWHEHIADPSHADAICDRLIHNAHKLVLKASDARKRHRLLHDAIGAAAASPLPTGCQLSTRSRWGCFQPGKRAA